MSDLDLCPMGCGNVTDDVAGGPCSRCWAALDQATEDDEDDD